MLALDFALLGRDLIVLALDLALLGLDLRPVERAILPCVLLMLRVSVPYPLLLRVDWASCIAAIGIPCNTVFW